MPEASHGAHMAGQNGIEMAAKATLSQESQPEVGFSPTRERRQKSGDCTAEQFGNKTTRGGAKEQEEELWKLKFIHAFFFRLCAPFCVPCNCKRNKPRGQVKKKTWWKIDNTEGKSPQKGNKRHKTHRNSKIDRVLQPKTRISSGDARVPLKWYFGLGLVSE